MKTITREGKKYKVKQLQQLHNIYCNYYGVNVYKLEDGTILLQAHKMQYNRKGEWTIVSREYYENLLDREDTYQCVLDVLEMLRSNN